MTINEIILCNFGVYAGQHSIDLRPKSKAAPVILVGALNGGGKTTLLDAIQLVLFGKLSKCSTRENYSYNEFLKRCITRGSDASAGSIVALNLRHGFDGAAHDFYIERSWRQTPKGVVEKLIVTRDGILDEDLTNNWLEYVDNFVPVGLAELFFFDGEKLEQIAQSNNAAKMLSAAINSLLGLDLVDRLEKDLIVYARDLNKTKKSKTELYEIQELEVQLEKLEDKQKLLILTKQTEANKHLDKAKVLYESAKKAFKKNGGEIYEGRKGLETKQLLLEEDKLRVKAHMRDSAAGLLPLLLLEEQIDSITAQANTENKTEKNDLLHQTLLEQKKKLNKQLKKWEADSELSKKINDHLNGEIAKLTSSDDIAPYLNLDQSEYISLKRLDRDTFESEGRNALSLGKQYQTLAIQIQQINDQLAKVPDDQAIAGYARELAGTKNKFEQAKAEFQVVEENITQASKEIQEVKGKLHKMLDKHTDEVSHMDSIDRKIKYAEKVRNTMRRFRATVLERKIRLIENLILNSFRQLLRKKDLLSAIKIDPETYDMSLLGRNGEDVPANRLSAGERQLLAVSTLWGLAQASGRAMPIVIDTPMARLDSEHRTQLIKNYFPNASHQVVILSTDEEIDDKYYPQIKSRVSHSYELSYCDKKQSSVINKGYFFK
jgi:DNA sulfur modification protein DndD